MTSLNSTSQILANDLLYGFDICDEETRQYLTSLIASGQAPQAELDELHELSLMRGAEDWDLLFECAEMLRGRSELEGEQGVEGGEKGLVPFLGAVLEGTGEGVDGGVASGCKGKGERKIGMVDGGRKKVVLKKKKTLRKGVSHFWGEDDDASEKTRLRQRRQNANTFGIWGKASSQDHRTTAGGAPKDADSALDGIALPQPQPPSPGHANTSATMNETSLETATREDPSPGQQPTSPTKPTSLTLDIKTTPKPGRAVKATGTSRSPFFTTPPPPPPSSTTPTPLPKKKPRPPRNTISRLPIPPLSHPHFGLIQEALAPTPFHLLIAITFLIRTSGTAAIPVFYKLISRFPTPQALAAEEATAEIVEMIRPLGLARVRCRAVQRYARGWVAREPRRGVRFGVPGYPCTTSDPNPGVRRGEVFGAEDGGGGGSGEVVDAVADARERAIGSAWEIGHLTQGPYALDSWRIFCRDVLLGRSEHWTGKGGKSGFQPEWMRVLPRDKELRACLRWMWYVLLA